MGNRNEQANKIRAKVSYALKNAENFSQEEIDSVWNEAVAFLKTLPKEERGEFYWNSGGMEALFLLTTESRGE